MRPVLDRTATLWTKGGTEAAGGAPYSIAVNSAKKRTSSSSTPACCLATAVRAASARARPLPV